MSTRARKRPRKAAEGKAVFRAVSSTERIVLWTLAGYLVVRFVAAFIGGGGARIWGFDVFAFVSDKADALIALALPFIAFLPPVRRRLGALLSRTSDAGAGGARHVGLAIVAVAAAAILVSLFQVAFAFLGDGSYYATEVRRIETIEGFRSALIKPTSFLTGHAIRFLTLALGPENVRTPFMILGMAGAGILVAAVFLFLRKETRSAAVLFSSVFLLSAGTLMFFGYIELYALAYACSAIFLLAMFSSFRHGLPVAVPGIVLAVAIAFGASAVLFLPAYLLLLHWKFRGTGGGFPLPRAAAVLAVLMAAAMPAAYALIGTAADSPYFLPLSPAPHTGNGIAQGAQSYTVFSPAHVADILNVLWLNAGALVPLLAVFAIALRGRIAWSSPLLLAALLAGLAGLLLLLFGNTILGLGRDWDLATIPALGVSFLTGVALLSAHESKALSLAVILPALLLALATDTYGWLRLNLDEQASAGRLETLIERDRNLVLPVSTYMGFENLRKFYQSVADEAKMSELLHRMLANGFAKNDTYDKLQQLAVLMRDRENRRREYGRLFDAFRAELRVRVSRDDYRHIDPAAFRASVTKTFLSAIQTGDADIAADRYRFFSGAIPAWKEAPAVEAHLTPGLTAGEIAAKMRQGIDTTTRDASLLVAAGNAQSKAGDFQTAVDYYEKSLERDPSKYPGVYIELARIQLENLHDRGAAGRSLERCIAMAPRSPEAAEAARILTLLRTQP